MSLTIYSTLSREKAEFFTLEPDRVKMYCCGVTVYDYCHLGHGRAYIVWDTVRRYLQWRGYQVQYIQNFTDIDDKILNRARDENSSMEAVARQYEEAYLEDLRRLNVLDADSYPRATEHIQEIIELIQDLVAKEFAYPAGGDVYFRVRKFTEYGKLSHRKLDDMQAGASERVEVEEPEQGKKEDPFDFALWKAAKPGEPFWESPWGNGRPGWHIECSAMIRSQLGQTIDIHCGGGDLVFPHHENEIAQSECAHDAPLSKYWMHNGMVTVNGTKMSKSLGNFTTLRDLLDGKWGNSSTPVDPMAVRLFVLTAQYRKPIDFTAETIAAATHSWQTIKEGLLFGYEWGDKLDWDNIPSSPLELSGELVDVEVVPPILSTRERKIQPLPYKGAPIPEPEPEVADMIAEIFSPFSKLKDNFGQFFIDYRSFVLLAIILFFTQFPVRFAYAFFTSVNTAPVLNRFFQFVGVITVARYLISRSWRQQVQTGFGNLTQQLLGDAQPQPALSSTTATPTIEPAPIAPLSAMMPLATGQNTATPANSYIYRFRTAVDDDFNFAEGLAVIFEIAKELRRIKNILTHEDKIDTDIFTLKSQWETLVELTGVLGLKIDPKEELKSPAENGLSDTEIEELLVQRKAARDRKDYAESDRIRDRLKSQGVSIVDKKGVSKWHRD
jgi:cysteinyl-tRNA synthetase